MDFMDRLSLPREYKMKFKQSNIQEKVSLNRMRMSKIIWKNLKSDLN